MENYRNEQKNSQKSFYFSEEMCIFATSIYNQQEY